MMLHRHFEEERKNRKADMTRLADLAHSDSTDPADPLYVPVDDNTVEGEPPRKPGRPRKNA